MYNGIIFRHKNKILPSVTTWVDMEGTTLSEISQKRQILYDLTYLQNLKSNS